LHQGGLINFILHLFMIFFKKILLLNLRILNDHMKESITWDIFNAFYS
jgi:hypothetical protein